MSHWVIDHMHIVINSLGLRETAAHSGAISGPAAITWAAEAGAADRVISVTIRKRLMPTAGNFPVAAGFSGAVEAGRHINGKNYLG